MQICALIFDSLGFVLYITDLSCQTGVRGRARACAVERFSELSVSAVGPNPVWTGGPGNKGLETGCY